ncbi:MAG: hypothetical protein HF982_00390 [Desulfobacteraceae bacterium]|nr:hypothetical protein [Desulfobacteraceae bacterium]MBC2718060.1 hypothetical protein [Desulfobacteraceae bacterium]
MTIEKNSPTELCEEICILVNADLDRAFVSKGTGHYYLFVVHDSFPQHLFVSTFPYTCIFIFLLRHVCNENFFLRMAFQQHAMK